MQTLTVGPKKAVYEESQICKPYQNCKDLCSRPPHYKQKNNTSPMTHPEQNQPMRTSFVHV